MPRPALSLYRQLPITYKHKSLILNTVEESSENIASILPNITSGFTGLLATSQQAENIEEVRESLLPKIIQLNLATTLQFNCSVEQAKALGASGVMVYVRLGLDSSNQQLDYLKTVVAQTRASKMIAMVKFVCGNGVSSKAGLVLHAYALQLSADYKVDYVLIEQPKSAADITTIFKMAGKGSLLIENSMLATTETRKMLAAGAGGIVLPLSEMAAQSDPGKYAYQLGEVVFGPGSYVPK